MSSSTRPLITSLPKTRTSGHSVTVDTAPIERYEILAVRASQFFLFAWLLVYLVNGVTAAFWFDGYPVNGPFQLFDPLRRISAGMKAGTDFEFFHGIGIPFLHYPFFWLFGKLLGQQSIQAAELSRQFTSLALFIATLFAFVRTAFRNSAQRWIAAATVIGILEFLFPHVAEPGHSLVSGRSSMPIFAFAVLQTRLSSSWKAILIGCLIACSFAFGTEHGFSLSLSLAAVAALAIIQQIFLKPFSLSSIIGNTRFVAIAGAIAAIATPCLFFALCGISGTAKVLHYNLVELPADQFWFFGSAPMPYLHDWRQLLFDHHVILCFAPTAMLLVFLAVLLWKYRGISFQLGRDWQASAAAMLIYGSLTAIPLIAILSKHYTFPQARIFLLVAALIFARSDVASSLFARTKRWLPRLAGSFSLLCCVAALLFLYHAVSNAAVLEQHRQNDHASFDKNIGEHWNSFMSGATQVLDKNRQRPTLSLWSEYAALLDAHYNNFQPAEDYIIHAVGPERWQHYLRMFRSTNPEFVLTMNSQFSFAEWLQNERWEFYEDVLNNYRPLAEVEHDTIWQRNAGPWILPSRNFQPVRLAAAGNSVSLPVLNQEEMVVVKLQYHVVNPWHWLPLIGGTPRYVVYIDGTPRQMPVTLPPYMNVFEFPVKAPAGQTVSLRFQTDSFLPNADLRIDAVSTKLLPDSPGARQMFEPRRLPSLY
jgi:hypothetical protein